MSQTREHQTRDAAATTRQADAVDAPGGGLSPLLLQRKLARRLARRASDGNNGVAEGAEAAVARSASSSGAPIPSQLQAKFEGSTGADLSGVRVHTGADSVRAAESVSARAFTVGNDVHFNQGEYNPSSSAGQHLLAHEVAHTVQQAGGGGGGAQFKLDVSQPGDGSEVEADHAADAMVLGAPVAIGGASGGVDRVLQREAQEEGKDKEKEQDANDVKAILNAGRRERDNPQQDTRTMLNGSSIGYRILNVYLKEMQERWWISGVGGTAAVKGIKLERSGEKNVSVQVGRDFILATDEARLQERVKEMGAAFEALGGGKTGPKKDEKPQTENKPPETTNKPPETTNKPPETPQERGPIRVEHGAFKKDEPEISAKTLWDFADKWNKATGQEGDPNALFFVQPSTPTVSKKKFDKDGGVIAATVGITWKWRVPKWKEGTANPKSFHRLEMKAYNDAHDTMVRHEDGHVAIDKDIYSDENVGELAGKKEGDFYTGVDKITDQANKANKTYDDLNGHGINQNPGTTHLSPPTSQELESP